MRIDLHTHSNASDGTETPADLMRSAARAGLDVVALTDHDTTAGWAGAGEMVAETGVALVRGTEISTRTDGIGVHLLSYLHDPQHPALVAMFERARSSRADRARLMVERLAVDHDLTWAEVQAQAGQGATIGRPHIADALVARGLAPDRSAAFSTLLHRDGPYYVRYWAPDTVAAVETVLAAGGVPVMAHPLADARGHVVSQEQIRALAARGLAGLEGDHPEHTPEQRARVRALAGSLGLLVTGSSDYHGDGKPNRLGECTTSAEVLAEIERRGRQPVLRP